MKNPSNSRVGCYRPLANPVNTLFCFSIFLGGAVLSLCSGSGSMLESCMQAGRDCLGVEIDGIRKFHFITFLFFLDVQFRGASARMREAYDVIMKDVAKNYNGDMERFRIIESLYFLFSVTIRRGVCSSCQIIWHPSMYACFFECH